MLNKIDFSTLEFEDFEAALNPVALITPTHPPSMYDIKISPTLIRSASDGTAGVFFISSDYEPKSLGITQVFVRLFRSLMLRCSKTPRNSMALGPLPFGYVAMLTSLILPHFSAFQLPLMLVYR